ncbi:permease-like cell division protein FtsX [Microbispora bryophytorum]|uniref:permease-like cell division protein FtsX n=2 Tax=Microbispora bryophytorum TaxID=1460882 RepID=UPI0033EFAD05
MTLPEVPQAEEMTIGVSRGRRRGPLAVVTAVLLVASCGTAGPSAPPRPVSSPSPAGSAMEGPQPDDPWPGTSALTPLPPPDGPWPETGELSVFFCARSTVFDACNDRGAATRGEIRKVRALLGAAPEVEKVRFVSQAEQFRRTREALRDRPDLLEGADPADESAYYSARVGPGDWPALVRRMSASPGVSNAFVIRDDYWPDKADVMVQLCPRADLSEGQGGPCEGRGFATLAEKNAILDRIGDLPGLEKVYFQARSHQAPMWRRRIVPEEDFAAYLPEVFYVKFTTPPVLREVKRVLRSAPGVLYVEAVGAASRDRRL